MSGEDFLDIPKTDETQQSTPEEMYFSRSKNEWLHVSDMSDMHVRRAFKRLLRMIRLGTLIELSDDKSTFTRAEIINEVNNISSHCDKIKKAIEKALSNEFKRMLEKDGFNPYGDGNSSENILKIVKEIHNMKDLTIKKLTY